VTEHRKEKLIKLLISRKQTIEQVKKQLFTHVEVCDKLKEQNQIKDDEELEAFIVKGTVSLKKRELISNEHLLQYPG
jgi:hypothetical protein